MKFELIEVSGLQGALLGMRLPMCKDLDGAREKSDSWLTGVTVLNSKENLYLGIGESDKKLCKNLIKGDSGAGAFGQPNAKYLRMIHAQICITAPLYWWKEADTYKIGTTANSTSTMHRLANYPITMDCFEEKDLVWNDTVVRLEQQRKLYNELVEIKELEKAKKAWKILIVNLPESWLQTRMFDVDYQTLRNIYHWRKNHKLTEWHSFCNWLKENLPYAEELICDEGEEG